MLLSVLQRRLNDARASRHGLIRVVDESGQDYLYPSSYFVAIAVPETARRALSHTRQRLPYGAFSPPSTRRSIFSTTASARERTVASSRLPKGCGTITNG